jgi:hypothetical protein
VLSFEPEARSSATRYRLRLSADGDGFYAWVLRGPVYPAGRLEIGGTAQPGVLLFDFSHATGAFERVAEIGRYRLHRYRNSLKRYFAVSSAAVAADDKELILRLRDPAHDVGRTVLLSAPLPAGARELSGSEPARPAEILLEEPGRVRLRVQRDEPGYLVAARTYFPGWKAAVNGEAAPIARANLAFQAVPIPAGASEVELVYAPRSFRLGALVSIASALAVAFLGIRVRHSPPLPHPS